MISNEKQILINSFLNENSNSASNRETLNKDKNSIHYKKNKPAKYLKETRIKLYKDLRDQQNEEIIKKLLFIIML